MVTIIDQIRAVGREVGMRKNVYPKWVASGRMTQLEADRELAAMEAAYTTLKLVKAMTEHIVERPWQVKG